jgi:hypothetical protein
MAVSLLVVLGLAASACGDDDEDDTGTGATEATDATEATSSATQATTGATTGDGGAEGIDLEQAAAIVEEFSVRPTEIPNTTPIEGEIPTGKRVYFISCGAPACEAEIPILQEAAEILEWELTAISTDPTKPEQITAAWDRVVNE